MLLAQVQVAAVAAAAIEKKAYTAAEVAARTTTGDRPAAETTSAYARKLGELAIQVVKDGGKVDGAAAGTAAAGASEVVDFLDLVGSRDFLTAEAAEAVLAPMLAPGSSVNRIRFSTKSFGRDAAAVAARALQAVSCSLLEADISDVIAGRPEDEALDVLRVLSSALSSAPRLTALNLSDNALGEKGVRACEAVLAGKAPLESLSLQNVGLSVHACRATSELLADPSRLRRLQLFNNMSGDEGAGHIAGLLSRAPQLEDLRFASSRVGPAGGVALAKSLMAGARLVRLDLSDNPLTSEVVPELAKALAAQPTLRALNLNDTSLGPDGVTEAVAALVVAHASSLRLLNLRENELGDRGALFLSRALGALAEPQTVDLVGNQIRRAGAVAVARALVSKSSLELLALDENTISDDGLDELRGVMEGAGKSAALGPLDNNMEEDEEEEEEEEEGEGGADDFGLSEALARSGIA
ncbi:hypothetical protein VOLCADRAFT_107530 [Volvox carteri f. nagariensis]|uniref:WPP domain-containing protein n=1 Tax=Volvox carteri f. nagariensis TaxID=3068 RepID=D8UEM6_VOLCA|nr:uncharacterized protein VOLCADRAFT_107530 [Volvox carteri f. nagariensis]EFJ41793.1 hypothetical protein VOLCADRAFT_107530 [Volvox carteri f. nagariensis]|eukprot:XP_002957139.1 hypothetical protein VOLCADRAFT_107530 [Volvox carteri f. nagariensis]